MASKDSESPIVLVEAAQGSKDLPKVYKPNDIDVSQPQPSNPPEMSPGGLTAARAPELVTLLGRHQTAIRHIRTLESHNARLYEDNCRLVSAVNLLNDRLAFFAAPQNTQVFRLADMQERLRTSEANLALINQKYQELLQCTSAGSVQHHMNEELQAIREAYASLDREYRLLGDKYTRLRAVTDANRAAQQQLQGTAHSLIPVVRSEFANTAQFRTHDQSRNSHESPSSVIPPCSLQPPFNQKGNYRRRSSESVMVQSLRSGPTPIATTWLAPLPTPPPSAPLPRGQTSPTGFPIHAPMSAGSFPLSHHPQVAHDPRILSRLPAATQSRYLAQQGTPEQFNAPHLRQCHGDITNTTNGEPVPCDKQTPPPASLTSPRPPKRPNAELQASMSPEGEHKKPRNEEEADCPTTTDLDACSSNKTLSPSVSTDPHNDRKLSVSDSNVRSYQDCVNLIFEKDANVEDGVFCGLCLDRHEAKMIPEPPDVLVQPDFDSLVRHCMTMHPAVWDDLRGEA